MQSVKVPIRSQESEPSQASAHEFAQVLEHAGDHSGVRAGEGVDLRHGLCGL